MCVLTFKLVLNSVPLKTELISIQCMISTGSVKSTLEGFVYLVMLVAIHSIARLWSRELQTT